MNTNNTKRKKKGQQKFAAECEQAYFYNLEQRRMGAYRKVSLSSSRNGVDAAIFAEE